MLSSVPVMKRSRYMGMPHNEVPCFSLEVCSSEKITKKNPPGGGRGSFLPFFPGSANLFNQKRAPHFDTFMNIILPDQRFIATSVYSVCVLLLLLLFLLPVTPLFFKCVASAGNWTKISLAGGST